MHTKVPENIWNILAAQVKECMRNPGYRTPGGRMPICCPLCGRASQDYGRLVGGTVPAYFRCAGCGFDSTLLEAGVRGGCDG